MDASFQMPLTSEGLAAVNAGGGFARVEDPATHRVYFLIEQAEPPTIDDNCVRDKLVDAYAEGNLEPLDMAAVKAEFVFEAIASAMIHGPRIKISTG